MDFSRVLQKLAIACNKKSLGSIFFGVSVELFIDKISSALSSPSAGDAVQKQSP
jgi:hypothetical protein